jgi:hypothetical protein
MVHLLVPDEAIIEIDEIEIDDEIIINDENLLTK